MPKISFAGLKNPGTRARLIIWLGAVVLGLAAFVIVAMGVTSTYWFCASACHKVQDDTITAYNHSAHSNIACMACHMPVNANPVIFVLHKAEALGELYMTVTNNYELPLNRFSAVSLEMKEAQCTQCHNMANRKVTPSEGVKIDHKIHSEKGIACPVCHNRTAHVEDFKPTLTDPQSGEPNRIHQTFMTMTSCFRCHTQDPKTGASAEGTGTAAEPATEAASEGGGEGEGPQAPGACIMCHPKNFDLVPAFHKAKGFFPKGHAAAAREAEKKVEEGNKQREEFEQALGSTNGTEPLGVTIPFVDQVNECSTCHSKKFCEDCHGMEIPHPEAFKNPEKIDSPEGHPVVSKEKPAKCVMCHGKNAGVEFCNPCHHGKEVDYTYNKAVPWLKQHPAAVEKSGLEPCFKACHDKKFCSDCHTKNKVVPASHRARYWTHGRGHTVTVWGKSPAKPSALHALTAQKSFEACEICHGAGGPNAAFCKGCHRMQMPHPDEFKKFHSKQGRKNPVMCQNCHTFKQICSNCHHIGSSFTVPWIQRHGASANAYGPANCTEKCHDKKFCVTCHTRTKPVPASHRRPNFTRNPSAKMAVHVQLYQKDASICTYCHGDGGPNAKFCRSCHKLPMPHPIDEGNKQKFLHKEKFQKKQLSRAACVNCHNAYFCNACHHTGASRTTPWLRYHPNQVRKGGAEQCFECHKEIYCSNCHVNLAKRGLL